VGEPPAAEPKMTLVELECDLLVAGGGLAGVCAAIRASSIRITIEATAGARE